MACIQGEYQKSRQTHAGGSAQEVLSQAACYSMGYISLLLEVLFDLYRHVA